MAKLNIRRFIGAIAYPPGSIYISTNAINPAEIWGGSWERFAQGRALVGIDENDSDFATVEKKIGAKTHTLTTAQLPSHSHSGSSSSTGSHTHGVQGYERTTYNSSGARAVSYVKLTGDSASSSTPVLSAGSHSHTISVGSTGSGSAHNNIQPSIAVYVWRRLSLFPKEGV